LNKYEDKISDDKLIIKLKEDFEFIKYDVDGILLYGSYASILLMNAQILTFASLSLELMEF